MTRLHFDFKDIISISFRSLHFFGIMHPNFDTFLVTVKYVIRVLFFLVFLFAGIVLAELGNLFLSMGDLSEMIQALFLTLTNLLSIAKFYVICKNQNTLQSLAEKINRDEFQPKSEKQVQSLRRYIKLSKILSFSLYTGCTMTCGFWAIYPYTEENGPFLPIAAYIPFNTEKSHVFGLVYAYEIIATIVGGYTELTVDCLIASLIMVVCAQLNILNDSLVNIGEMAEMEMKQKSYSEKNYLQIKQKIINQNLIDCINHHKACLEFASEVISLFTTAIFGQFLVSVFVLCTTLFEMISVPIASVRFFSMALYLYCMLLQIFPVCYFGNEVIIESNKLTNSAYHSDWIDYSVEIRKNLVIFMIGTQRILELSVRGLFTLSLDTFLKILKSAMSYVAVLIQLKNKL